MVDDVFGDIRDRLEQFIRIPSVSAEGFDLKYVRESAEETASWLEGLFTETLVSAQMPIAIAAAPVTSTRIFIDLMIVSSPGRGTRYFVGHRARAKVPGASSMPREQFSFHSRSESSQLWTERS